MFVIAVVILCLAVCPFCIPQRLNGVRLAAENDKNQSNQDEGQQKVYKKCSTVLMGSIEKVSTEYVWELRKFLDYMEYLNDFDPTFELNSETVNFTTVPDLGGTWNFRIFKEQLPQAQALQKDPVRRPAPSPAASAGGTGNYTNGAGGTNHVNGAHTLHVTPPEPPIEMSVQAIHTWAEIVSENTAEKRGINYKAILEIRYNGSAIFKEAKTTIPDTQFKFLNTGRYRQQYSYTFKWRNIQSILANVVQEGAAVTEADGGDGTEISSSIVFYFKMIAFLPNESKILSSNCDA